MTAQLLPTPPPPVANNDLVTMAWIRTIPGVDFNQVGTTLPGDASKWSAAGFIQITSVGGSPHPDIPTHRPVMGIDTWAVGVSQTGEAGGKPPWGKANALAEMIRAGCYRNTELGVIPLNAPGLYARVQSVMPTTEPFRMPGDDARYARYHLDLQLIWVDVENPGGL